MINNSIEQFLEAIRAERSASRNTCHAYERDLMAFHGHLEKQGGDLLSATQRDIARYLNDLSSQGRSTSTQARKLAVPFGNFISLRKRKAGDPTSRRCISVRPARAGSCQKA